MIMIPLNFQIKMIDLFNNTKIASLNVRGLNNTKNQIDILSFIKNINPDIILLQETKPEESIP